MQWWAVTTTPARHDLLAQRRPLSASVTASETTPGSTTWSTTRSIPTSAPRLASALATASSPLRFLALAVALATQAESDEQVRQNDDRRDADEHDPGTLRGVATDNQQRETGNRDHGGQHDADQNETHLRLTYPPGLSATAAAGS